MEKFTDQVLFGEADVSRIKDNIRTSQSTPAAGTGGGRIVDYKRENFKFGKFSVEFGETVCCCCEGGQGSELCLSCGVAWKVWEGVYLAGHSFHCVSVCVCVCVCVLTWQEGQPPLPLPLSLCLFDTL